VIDQYEQFQMLVDWHRNTQKMIGQLQFMVTALFVVVVVPVVLRWFGIEAPW
jgi:hypothetical protein